MSERQNIVVSSMQQRKIEYWNKNKKQSLVSHRLLIFGAAAAICLAVGSSIIVKNPASISVMSHIDTGFEYDETLGRLQYVSNILPDSAMVFLSNSGEEMMFSKPAASQLLHAWNPSEPWMEYHGISDVFSCQSGEVATVVKNRNDEYTVRILHDDGYESVYSGLTSVYVNENDVLQPDAQIGHSKQKTAFELRKDGISILPVFQNQ